MTKLVGRACKVNAKVVETVVEYKRVYRRVVARGEGLLGEYFTVDVTQKGVPGDEGGGVQRVSKGPGR